MPRDLWADVGTLIREVGRRADELRVGDDLRVHDLFVDGVEVTQAIQYRRAADHLTDPADRGPDNSVRLVADKPAYVRVYVRSARLSDIPGVTGSVTVQRRSRGVWHDAGGTLTQAFPAAVTAQPAPGYAAERGDLSRSLNFVLPAALVHGRLRLVVRVGVAGEPSLSAQDEVELNCTLMQTLHLRGIPVRYWGPDAAGNQVQLPAPTLGDFQRTAASTLQMWPVSQTPAVELAGTFTQGEPLTGAIVNGQCPSSWNNLLLWLGVAKVLDGNRTDRLYYALLPSGIPIGGASGCGGGDAGVGAGFLNDGMAMAHELGHVLGFPHAPSGLGAGDTNDPSYPAYEPYDTVGARTASLGEYGLDTSAQTVYSPGFAKDFMSYSGPPWISLYHYLPLLEHPRLDPRWVADPADRPPYLDEVDFDPVPRHLPDPVPRWLGPQIHRRAEPDPEPLVVLTGVVEDERVDVRSVLRLETGPIAAGQRLEGVFAELLDAEGVVLARAAMRRMATYAGGGCGCGPVDSADDPPSGLVQGFLPDREGAVLRVVREEEELWSRRAPDDSPRVEEVSAELDGDEVRVRWSASLAEEHPAERAVRWSTDDGRSWQALALALAEDEATVGVEAMTSGPVLVQVLVSDGFHTAVSEPVGLDVPPRAPQVAILAPVEDGVARAGAPLRLWGAATASGGRRLPDEALEWELDGERVGAGPEVWSELPDWEGEHRCRLRATDGDRRSEAVVTFWATSSGRRPQRATGRQRRR